MTEIIEEEKNEVEFVPKNVRWNISSAMEIVLNTLEDSELNIERTDKYETAMSRLKDYFGVNEIQVWILTYAISIYFRNSRGGIDLDDISHFIGCKIFKVINWTKDIAELIKLQFLQNRNEVDDFDDPSTSVMVNPSIVMAVANNTTYEILEESEIDYIEFVRQMARMFEGRRDEDKNTRRLIRDMSALENKYQYMDFVQKSIQMIQKKEFRFFFYDMCDDFLSGNDTAMERTICDMYDSVNRFKIARMFMDDSHPLLKLELVEFTRKGSMRDATLTLTSKGKQLLLGENASLFEKQMDDKLLIKCESIKQKTLFYSEENQKQLERLKSILSEERLPEIQKRLKESGMPVGVAVLLFGEPGTGKTESVYQIARDCGRNIVHVDISDSKSCWFGESEKKIKQVFVRYKRMCQEAIKQTGKIPILLFNEADAIFAKRKDSTSTNVAQTENAIQNIILEEMENLEGILIATTNLATNLDAAFERRFLFKIKFENPSIDAKKSIWLDKLKWLSEKDAESFAKAYELSGGQIDNIVRKITMNEVITGKRPEISEIDDMCRVEKLDRTQIRKVGFAS